MKHILTALLILVCTFAFAQVRPDQAPLVTEPDSSNFEVYSQKATGFIERANLYDLKEYFAPSAGVDTLLIDVAELDTVSGREMSFFVDKYGERFYADRYGVAFSLSSPNLVAAAPDTSIFTIYAPGHNLTDSIAARGYVPINQTSFSRARSSNQDSIQFGYAIGAPHPDSLQIRISGELTYPAYHGLEVGRLYYLQDDGSEATTPGTITTPTAVVLDSFTIVLTEVGPDISEVIQRQAIPSPVIVAAGGDPLNPSDSIIQSVIENVFLPARLARPGTIFFTSYSSQSSNPTYQNDSPTGTAVNPSNSWLWDGQTATRMAQLLVSVDLQATTIGLFPLDTVLLIGGIPTDSTVANWLDTNYVKNNLRLPNGSILYWKGSGTAQDPDYSWIVIDDITNTTEANDFKRIIKRVNGEYISRQELLDSLKGVPRVWLNGQEDFFIPCGFSTVDINLAFSILDDQPVDTAYFSIEFVGTPWTYIEKGVDGFDFYSIEIPGLAAGSYLWDIDVTDADGNNIYLTSAIDITAQTCGTPGAITGSLTTGRLPRASGATSLADSDISDDGSVITVGASRDEIEFNANDSIYATAPLISLGDPTPGGAYVRIDDANSNVTLNSGGLNQKIVLDNFGVSFQVDGGNYYFPSFQAPTDGKFYLPYWFNGSSGWYNITDTVAVAGGGGGSGGHIIADEGTALAPRDTLDFQGAGVTVTDGTTKTIVTITSDTVTTLIQDSILVYSLDGVEVGRDTVRTPGVGGVTGSGTTNYLPKWNSSGAALDNSLLYDSGTNIGLGSTTPSEKLHIRSTGADSWIRLERTDASTRATGIKMVSLSSGWDWYFDRSSTLTLYWDYNSVNKMKLSSTGDLTVTGGLSFTGNLSINPSFQITSGASSIDLYDASTASMQFRLGNPSVGRFEWQNNSGAELMTLLPGGNLGLNTPTPSYILDINGTGGARIPVGTTAQRPTGADGVIRYNSTISRYEAYDDATWNSLAYTTDITTNTNIANTNLTATGDRTVDWATYDLTFDFDSHALDEFAIQYNSPSGKVYGEYINDTDGYMFSYRQAVYTPAHLGDVVPRPLIAHNNTDMVTVGNPADSVTMQGNKLYLDIGNAGTDNAAVNRITTIDSSTDEVKILDLTPQSGSGAPGVAPRYNGDRYFDYTNAKWYSAWDNENGDGTGDGLDADDWIILN